MRGVFNTAFCCVLFWCQSTIASHTTINPIELPKFTVQGITLMPATTSVVGLSGQNGRPGIAWGGAVVSEMPVIRYLHSGISLNVAALSRAQLLVELGSFFKPQFPITLPFGHIGLYGMFPFGLSIPLALPWLDAAGVVEEKITNIFPQASPSIAGIGIHAAAMGGFEYYPIPEFGLFAEAGYRYSLFGHRMSDMQGNGKGYLGYHMYGVIINFGVRFAT